jgi:putative membrane protein
MAEMIPLSNGAGVAIPYCGRPPLPETLLDRWNLDPILIACLVLTLAAYAGSVAIAPPSGVPAGWRRACFYAGWAVGALALVSPLCALSVSLFSARVGQHMLLTVGAAPLVILGRPGAVLIGRWTSHRWSPSTQMRGPWDHPLIAAVAFAVALWFWHAPAPYEATFHSSLVYWAMHLTAFGSALWLWSALMNRRAPMVPLVAASFLTTAQMALLGAVLCFAGQALYEPHRFTTQPWGLTPLEDQQLGGVVMWVPAGVFFAAALIVFFAQTMRRNRTGARGYAFNDGSR